MSFLLFPLGIAAAGFVAWMVARQRGRGRPYPVWLSGFLLHRLYGKFSRPDILIERASITSGMRVLDAGCGPGRLSIPIAKAVMPGGEVVALDLQEGMLSRVRERAAGLRVTNIRTVCVPLEPEAVLSQLGAASFDRALLVTVLGEVPDPGRALAALFGILKPDGILSITETVIDPDYMTRGIVTDLAERAGFQRESSFGNALTFTINFRKSG